MNAKEFFKVLVGKITLAESADEIQSIVYLYLEQVYGFSRTQILTGASLGDVNLASAEDFVARINRHEPLQYILGEAFFYGRKFTVAPAVLIPRPETEMLVQLTAAQQTGTPPTILDIGTGSGCIAITLALEIPGAKVYALDVSSDALAIARRNADALHASITFIQNDILTQVPSLPALDFIVSNPPYIMQREKIDMQENVLGHEPHLALFVPDEDPLLFYRTIAKKGKHLLKRGGKVFVEINAQLGAETADLFKEHGYLDVTIIKDLEGKDRVVMAVL